MTSAPDGKNNTSSGGNSTEVTAGKGNQFIAFYLCKFICTY